MTDVLVQITERRLEDVAKLKAKMPLSFLRERLGQASPVRSFKEALHQKIAQKEFAIIAEIKKASPSAGAFAMHHDVVQCAQSYEEAGAAALSVLTEPHFFKGALGDMDKAKQATQLPILRKDFILDEWQIYEARLHNADAILLIMASLEPSRAHELYQCARALDMAVIAEAHDEKELTHALALKEAIVGINSRNLKTLAIDHDKALRLHQALPDGRLAIAESGIQDKETFLRYRASAVRVFLMGEHLMRQDHVGTALAQYTTLKNDL